MYLRQLLYAWTSLFNTGLKSLLAFVRIRAVSSLGSARRVVRFCRYRGCIVCVHPATIISGRCGYGRKSHALKKRLETAFDGKISVTEIKDYYDDGKGDSKHIVCACICGLD